MSFDLPEDPRLAMNQVTKIGKDENIIIWLLYKITYPLAKLLVCFRVSPNSITSLSFIFVGIANISAINGPKIDYFLYTWMFAVFLDLADGQVARITNKSRRQSFSFDHTSDLIKISATLISFGILYTSNLTWTLVSTCICVILVSDQLNSELSHARKSGVGNQSEIHIREHSSIANNAYTIFFTFNTHTLLIFPLLLINRSLFVLIIGYFIFLATLSSFRFIYLLIQIPRHLK